MQQARPYDVRPLHCGRGEAGPGGRVGWVEAAWVEAKRERGVDSLKQGGVGRVQAHVRRRREAWNKGRWWGEGGRLRGGGWGWGL